MLKRFYVNNLKNLLNVEFQPTGLNLLIGPNNSGKTNLCSALRFLSLTSQDGTSFQDAANMAVGGSWRFMNVYEASRSLESQFEVECTLEYEGQPLHYVYRLGIGKAPGSPNRPDVEIELKEERLTVTGEGFNGVALLKNEKGEVTLLHETNHLKKSSALERRTEVLTDSRRNISMLSRLYELKDNPRASLFKRYLQSWLYFNLSPRDIRSPDVSNNSRAVFPNGQNFTQALYRLHNENPRIEKDLISLVKELEPKLELISYYMSPESGKVFPYLEDKEGNRFSLYEESDGTVHLMALAYVILMARATEPSLPSRLIMVEEPENGLYVGHLKRLISEIDPSGKTGQFVFTTHNPYFIDLFDTNLGGLHLMKPGMPSSRLTQPDPNKIQGMLGQMSLGEMHFRELLD